MCEYTANPLLEILLMFLAGLGIALALFCFGILIASFIRYLRNW